MMWDKMGWKSNQNEGQNDIYYLAINEWNWVGYEELSRSRRVLSTEAAVFNLDGKFCKYIGKLWNSEGNEHSWKLNSESAILVILN